jgi:hypothetical protein
MEEYRCDEKRRWAMRECGAGKRINTYMSAAQKMLVFLQAEAVAAKARTTMAAKHFMLTDLDLDLDSCFCLWVKGRMYLKD